jgi:hypothetical protein
MQNNNGVKQRFLDCFLKILDKKHKNMARTTPRPVELGRFNKTFMAETRSNGKIPLTTDHIFVNPCNFDKF